MSTKLAVEMPELQASFDPEVNARRIYCVSCTTDLCLSVNKLKEEKYDKVSVQKSVST